MEAPALAIGAEFVGAVARKEHADMHFVRLAFEPAEITFDAIPRARPFVLRVLAVIRVAVDEPVLPFFRQFLERDIRWRLAYAAKLHEIGLAFGALAGQPGLDDAFRERLGAIRQGKVVIYRDDAAKAPARRTSADGMVEAEQRGGRFSIFNVARCTMKPIGK